MLTPFSAGALKRQIHPRPSRGSIVAPTTSSNSHSRASVLAPIGSPTVSINSHPTFFTTVVAMPIEAFVAVNPQAAAQAATEIAVASNQAKDVLAIVANSQSIGGEVAYNFVHFNPADLLNDAIASFTAESASISPPTAESSTARAWTVTAAVIGMDVLFMGYWYQKSRRDENSRRRTQAWALTIDPCQRRLL